MVYKEDIDQLRLNKILVFDNFLTPTACNKMLFLMDNTSWQQGRTILKNEQNKYVDILSTARTNSVLPDYSFTPQLKKKVAAIQKLVVNLFNLNKNNFESWQISKYGIDDHFDFHLDCGLGNDSGGDREKTILLYLNSPASGGETFFRALNLSITPVQGRLVVWDNLLPTGDCNHAMIHAGLPVKQGLKITLNTWYRQYNISHKIKQL